MASHKIFIVGKFQAGNQKELLESLSGIPEVSIAEQADMTLLIASDIVVRKAEKPAAWNYAREKKIPIAKEGFLDKLLREKKWSNPTGLLHDIVDGQSEEPNHEDESDGNGGAANESNDHQADNAGNSNGHNDGNAADAGSSYGDGKATGSNDIGDQNDKAGDQNGNTDDNEGANRGGKPRPTIKIESCEEQNTAPQLQAAGCLTSDRYIGMQIPAWAKIVIPASKTPEGISAPGVIEAVITGGYLLVSEMTSRGCRRGYLLSGSDHSAEKHSFCKSNREVLSNELLSDWKHKGFVLGSDVCIDLVAQSTAKTIAIAFFQTDRRPLLFTATMMKSIWGKNAQNLMQKVMDKADQGPFLSRADMQLTPQVNSEKQSQYLMLRSRAISEEMSFKESLSPVEPQRYATTLPAQPARRGTPRTEIGEELKKALEIIKGLSSKQIEDLLEGA